MNWQAASRFFMWCTIVNMIVLLFWSVLVIGALDWGYEMHKTFVPLTREYFEKAMYCFLGLFKILVIIFNVAPWVACTIVKRKRS